MVLFTSLPAADGALSGARTAALYRVCNNTFLASVLLSVYKCSVYTLYTVLYVMLHWPMFNPTQAVSCVFERNWKTALFPVNSNSCHAFFLLTHNLCFSFSSSVDFPPFLIFPSTSVYFLFPTSKLLFFFLVFPLLTLSSHCYFLHLFPFLVHTFDSCFLTFEPFSIFLIWFLSLQYTSVFLFFIICFSL